MRTVLAALVVAAICVPSPATAHSDIDLMARTAYWEARSDGARGMLAVCWVIRNRGGTVRSVVHQPAQFSVWSKGGPARRKAIRADDPDYATALHTARQVLAGGSRDPTGGATFYYEKTMRPPPSWARGMRIVARIGSHIFLRPRRG